ncbi:G-box-binding factor 3-like isoform X1 [Musa acuminata AAA Group]|uniref:G-box-binding factor 3-like isoform X1 n=1 Tax=Musa acuminata AAA Group TaxID=214697 RepID=UPI0031D28F01
MGNNETTTPSKSEKPYSPVQLQEQPAVHPYPDWAAMQAYYGPGVMPPPYFGTSVVPGHAPHPYMWAPQPFIPHFGSPYAGMYPHGVYPHSSLPPGTHGHYPGLAPSSAATKAVVMATPLSIEMPDKASGSRDKGVMTKLKRFDGLTVSVDSRSTNNAAGAYGNELSQSGYNSAAGSSNGSDGSNSAGGSKDQRKRSSEDIQSSDDRKVESNSDPAQGGERSSSSKLSSGVTVAHAKIAGNPVINVPSPCQAQMMSVKTIDTPGRPPTIALVPGCNSVPSELWTQDERSLKRERRKQSNRESARRSRLRKQAENEELAKKVEALSAENRTLISKISQVTESSETLRLENAALLEKLNARSVHAEESSPDKMETDSAPSVVVENFLSMIDKQSSSSLSEKQDDEKSDKSNGKLRQLMDTSPTTDAVAAS